MYKFSKHLVVVPLVVGLGSLLAWCSAPSSVIAEPGHNALAHDDAMLRPVPVHSAEFSPVASTAAFSQCGASRLPEPLATPDPLLPLGQEKLPMRVSFIVGTDGHVYSAFVLDSGGTKEDKVILRAVRRWRFRPATCNGIPTDFEARVQFRSR